VTKRFALVYSDEEGEVVPFAVYVTILVLRMRSLVAEAPGAGRLGTEEAF
jgi:hypothetical protein